MFLRRPQRSSGSDEDLIARIRGGEVAALGELWDRYAHLLYGVAMNYLKDPEAAKDLVVDLFAALPELLRKHAVERFRPWVHTVARNRCLMTLRKPGTVREPEQWEQATDADGAEADRLHEYTLQQLEQAVNGLAPGQRSCITLFYFERHSYSEIAALLGIPVDQVRSNIQNGRRNLRIILQHHVQPNT
jgi:RNA polymerase sigma factor (sigma-70 family)